ncbi:SCO family protein [Actinospica durhamensis]|uniref:SCO family protein n=1 Tax=Actinospica durhamensis TaxID=1508375 RepID=A0A941EML2_9ACTN|nr:SCO family protein [Actinospica durhamensis]MBR7834467.1 SCO family protein [Actinospica durhamensis]
MGSSPQRRTRPTRRARRALCAAAALALMMTGTLAACSSATTDAASSGLVLDSTSSSLFDGIQLGKPYTKPDLTLTDSDGATFNLLKGTTGKLTLVYFGYTHCPDVCPTTMATLASAVRALPAAQAARVQVVFVSTDPTRDTPAVLKAWLGQYNPSFIGLTGSFATIQKAATSLGIDIEAPVKQADGGYTVTHGAEVIAFDAKDRGYIVYTAGTTVDQFTHDIPLILAGRDA